MPTLTFKRREIAVWSTYIPNVGLSLRVCWFRWYICLAYMFPSKCPSWITWDTNWHGRGIVFCLWRVGISVEYYKRTVRIRKREG